MTTFPKNRLRRFGLLFAKLAIMVVVLAAVAHSFRDALGDLDQQAWHVEPLWLIAAGTLYLLGLLPMALYWRGLLLGLSYRPTYLRVLRAYTLGHLAKYVPGKALTLVVRSAAVKRGDEPATPIVATVFLETLTLMAIGGCLAAFFIERVLENSSGYSWLTALFAAGALLPLLPPFSKRLLNWLIRRRLKSFDQQMGTTGVSYSWRLFAAGCVASVASWVLLGLSIWATARAVGADQVSPFGQLDLWIVAAALPVVAGFLSMIPGGLVVRDGLMLLILGPALGEPTALVVTALIRITWLVSECFAYGILEVAHRMCLQQSTVP